MKRDFKNFLIKIIYVLIITLPIFLSFLKYSNAASPLSLISSSTGGTNIAFFPSETITLTFNQRLVTKESTSFRLYKVEDGPDVRINISYTLNKNILKFTPLTNYEYGQGYYLVISNAFAMDDTLFPDYTYNFQILSYQPTTLGYSKRGRAINGYTVGNGTKTLLLVGGIHGNERNTVALLINLLKDLDVNKGLIPEDKKVLVIPNANPDGYKINVRFNASGVDLNRNFKTTDWRRGVWVGSYYFRDGGGMMPFSEPESRLLKNITKQYLPYATVSYHSSVNSGYTIPSGRSSYIMAETYAKKAKYAYKQSGAFLYRITGDFTTWAYQNKKKAFTVELFSTTSHEFSRNRSAIWYLIAL